MAVPHNEVGPLTYDAGADLLGGGIIGGGGISAVAHDTSLTGDGTTANPLGLTGGVPLSAVVHDGTLGGAGTEASKLTVIGGTATPDPTFDSITTPSIQSTFEQLNNTAYATIELTSSLLDSTLPAIVKIQPLLVVERTIQLPVPNQDGDTVSFELQAADENDIDADGLIPTTFDRDLLNINYTLNDVRHPMLKLTRDQLNDGNVVEVCQNAKFDGDITLDVETKIKGSVNIDSGVISVNRYNDTVPQLAEISNAKWEPDDLDQKGGKVSISAGGDVVAEFRNNWEDHPSTRLNGYLEVETDTTVGGKVKIGGDVALPIQGYDDDDTKYVLSTATQEMHPIFEARSFEMHLNFTACYNFWVRSLRSRTQNGLIRSQTAWRQPPQTKNERDTKAKSDRLFYRRLQNLQK
jgi:hypothetical protein